MPSSRTMLAVGGFSAAALWLGPGAAAHVPPIARAISVPLSLPQRSDSLALTFDDGPHPEGTVAVLEALGRAGATASFFVVGEQAQRYPTLVREIVDAGHEVAVHGFRHRNQMRLTPRAFERDLERAIATIGELARRPLSVYRPPYGVFTFPGLAAVRRASLKPLLWSRWGRDWRGGTTPEEIAALATTRLQGGEVVLLHDADWYSSPGSHLNTARALPAILARVRELGLRTVAAGAVL